MAFNINNFKNNLVFGGARASLFEVQLELPKGLLDTADGINDGALTTKTDFTNKLTFLCSAAAIPPSTISNIEVPYFGRKVKVAGNRTFESWTVTVMNDEDFAIRRGFELWSAAINGHASNVKNAGVNSRPTTYQVEAIVRQYAKNDSTTAIRTYKLQNVFPTAISSIELNWGTVDEIETFTVELQYDYWTVEGTTPSSTGAV